MSRSHTKLFLVSLVMGGFLFIPCAYAGSSLHATPGRTDHTHNWQDKREQRIQKIFDELNLTEGQKAQLEANKQKSEAARRSFFEQLHSLYGALNRELMNPNLNMEKINQIQSRLKMLRAQMSDDHLQSILEVRKILTHEQFVKFISLVKHHRHTPGEKKEGTSRH